MIFFQSKKFTVWRWKRGGNFQITISKQPFQISHDCYTENVYHSQYFGKSCVQKLLEIYFFEICGLCSKEGTEVRQEGKSILYIYVNLGIY